MQEGSGIVNAEVTVHRTGNSSGTVGVTASTVAGGSATAGADFTATTTVLTWEDGDISPKTFTIAVLPDSLAEPDETVMLQLSAPTGGAIPGSQTAATLTILDTTFGSWQLASFGENANSPEARPTADFDADGRSNLLEFALGTNPALSQAGPGYTVDSGSGDHLIFSFTRPLEPGGLILRIRASDALASETWDTLATKIGEAAWTSAPGVTVNDNSTTGEVIVTDSESIGEHPKRFLRLEAELP